MKLDSLDTGMHSTKPEPSQWVETDVWANVDRRTALRWLFALPISAILSKNIQAAWMWFSIDPSRQLYAPAYRHWTDPTWAWSKTSRQSEQAESNDTTIESYVDPIFLYIKGEKYAIFDRFGNEKLKDVIKKTIIYLWAISNNSKSTEFFSFLEQILKLFRNEGFQDTESVFLLQIFSYLDIIPRRFALSDWSAIDTGKIFGSRWNQSYDNNELSKRINEALRDNSGKNPKEKLKFLIK